MDASSPVHAPMDPSQYDSLIGVIVPGQSLLFRMIIDNLPDKCGKILELGCGTGLLSGMLREACPSAAIDAIDISEEMVLAARKKKDLSDVAFLVRDLRERRERLPRLATVSGFAGSIRNAGFFRVWVPFTAGFVGLVIGEVGNGRIHPVPESGFCPCSSRDGWALCRP
ncbi:MAG TPA: class I SAM-dependent methyltransferase [Methanolinea sp.]|nr:class I SAM-dependent methyltransferase [Methanolinea sp.]